MNEHKNHLDESKTITKPTNVNYPRTRIQWKLVERRKPKSFVIRSSSAGSAKNDLKLFVNQNQLQYRYQQKKDPGLAEFENMFETLNLNGDDDLLERADRRELPAKFQLQTRNTHSDYQQTIINNKRETVKSKSSTVPIRRSVMPNVILDDLAYRRYNKNRDCSPSRMVNNEQPNICYMFLNNYEDLLNSSDSSSSSSSKFDPLDESSKDPNLINDDLLNRKLKPGTRVPAPPPPFGIPNSPIIPYYGETDYSKAELDWQEIRKPRFRSKERIPHLINDDLAFRNLRKDARERSSLTNSANSSFNDINKLTSQPSTSNICLDKVRKQLRPINRSTSLASSVSSSSTMISSSATSSPISDLIDFPS